MLELALWSGISTALPAADGLDQFDEREEHGEDNGADGDGHEHHGDGREDAGEDADAGVGLLVVHAGEGGEGGGKIAGVGGEFNGGGYGGGEDRASRPGACGSAAGDDIGEVAGFF